MSDRIVIASQIRCRETGYKRSCNETVRCMIWFAGSGIHYYIHSYTLAGMLFPKYLDIISKIYHGIGPNRYLSDKSGNYNKRN